MYINAEGIVLRSVPFSDSRTVLTVYTRERGIVSLVLRISRSKTNRNTIYAEPLTQAEFTFNVSGKSSMPNVKEARLTYMYSGLSVQFDKRTIATFLNELILRSIREEDPDPAMFNYIRSGLITLDTADRYTDFHIWFMAGLTHHLGFSPRFSKEPYLDLMAGEGVYALPDHAWFITREEADVLLRLVIASDHRDVKLDRKERKRALHNLLVYYKLHIDGFGDLRSVEVLEALYGELMN